MNFKNYCIKSIKELDKKILETENKIAEFPPAEEIKIEEYGSKREISSKIIRQKGSKIRHVIFKPSNIEIKKYIRNIEINSLKTYLSHLKDAKEQLQKAIECINEEKNIFESSIYPNNYIIKSILDYILKNPDDFQESFNLIISLFKSLDEKSISLTGKIEMDIGKQFDDDYTPKIESSLSSIIFTLDKLFKGIIKDNQKAAYESLIEKIKTHIKSSKKTNISSQNEKESLQNKKQAIKELQKYIENGKIVSPTPSIEYFKNLLIIAEINSEVANDLINQMSLLLIEFEMKENLELLKRNLTDNEVDIWQKAKSLEQNINNQALKSLLNRLTGDIVSACKYFELMPLPEERNITFEIISQRIDSISSVINNTISDNKDDNVFYYATNQDSVPYALLNIESIDNIQYDEIYKTLQALAAKEEGNTSSYQIEETKLRKLEGNKVDIYFSDICEKPIIVAIHTQTLQNAAPYIPKSVRHSIGNIAASERTDNFRKTQETYERLILQSLDLRTINDDIKKYKLTFTKQK